MVTSNPSPAYLQRVAAVFKDNGQGVRGDMQAVITAILMDDEARNTNSPTFTSPNYGRVQEPLLRFTHMARAFTAESRSGAFDVGSTEDPAYGFAEMASRAPSVFNWFAPGYIPAGTTHRAGRADRAGDGDHRRDHRDRLPQQHAGRRVWRLRQQQRPLHDAGYGDGVWPTTRMHCSIA